jgi:hypothetical protein
MNSKLRTLAIGILGTMIVFTSCTKVGPTGLTGATGPTGLTGSNGAVNVVNQYLAITPSQLVWDSTSNQWGYKYYTVNFNSSTNAAVLVYVLSNNGYEATPYTNSVKNYSVSFANNLIQTNPYIYFEYYNGTSTCPLPTSNINVQLVIIPPAMIIPNVNHNNYAEVKTAYNL